MNDSIIHVENLSKSFGTGTSRADVLCSISLDVQEGEFVSIMGPSGCGKSTLLYLIGGLDVPDSGLVRLCGYNMAELSDAGKSQMRRRDVGIIFQFYNLVPNLTVEENILLPAIMNKEKSSEHRESLEDLLGLVDLQEKRHAFPTELSGGQQQRVAIARSLIMHPRVLLADEPTGNLDRRAGEGVMSLFQYVNQTMDITILQVTHNKDIACCSNRLITMGDGVIESDEPLYPTEIESGESAYSAETEG